MALSRLVEHLFARGLLFGGDGFRENKSIFYISL